MQTAKDSSSERKLLIMAALFIVLGVCLLIRDGHATGAFWLLGVAANISGVLAVLGKKWTEKYRGQFAIPLTKLVLALLLLTITFSTGLGDGIFALAIRQGDTLLARGALLLGANKNATVGSLHQSLLGIAVDRKQYNAVRFLLEAGADPNRADRLGWTPLSIARYRNDEAMVALLLQQGAVERPLPVLPKKK